MEAATELADSSDGHGQEPSKKGSCRFLLRIARGVLIAYLLILVLAMFFEESLIFFPTPYPGGNWEPEGVAFEEASFQSADGTKLHGWYAPCENPRAVVLFCHGNAGNITHRAHTLAILNELVGVSVLIFDYRGYGRSEGKPSEAGVLADGRAARAWLAAKAGVKEPDVVLMGRSLGGAVAVDMAADDGARGLVLESSFTSIAEMAAHHYPWLPVRAMLRTKLDSLGKIAAYRGPLLQSHGEADSIVPYAMGRRLFEAASEPKRFVTLPGADHNDMQSREYFDALIEFLDGLEPSGRLNKP